MQDGKWVSASNKAGLTLRFENSGGKPPGPYCRNLEEAPAEGEVRPSKSPDMLSLSASAVLTQDVAECHDDVSNGWVSYMYVVQT